MFQSGPLASKFTLKKCETKHTTSVTKSGEKNGEKKEKERKYFLQWVENNNIYRKTFTNIFSFNTALWMLSFANNLNFIEVL